MTTQTTPTPPTTNAPFGGASVSSEQKFCGVVNQVNINDLSEQSRSMRQNRVNVGHHCLPQVKKAPNELIDHRLCKKLAFWGIMGQIVNGFWHGHRLWRSYRQLDAFAKQSG